MSDIAIRAEGLGKRYRIGQKRGHNALRDVLMQAAKAPLRKFRGKDVEPSNKPHRHIWALKDASFEIQHGEVVGLVGRNGAGKSTLLKLLARITKPTEGFAKVRGRMGSLLEVGSGFHSELTGRENVYLSGAILGMSKREITRKFDEIVAFAEVEKFIDTALKHYSTGMQMRLAFAVAAHLDTEILLIDEVLAVGDAQFQKKCLSKMDQVSHQGRTVVLVSHYMNVIEQLCGRVLLLESGLISADSQDVRAILTKYTCGDEENVPVWANCGSQFDNPYLRPLRLAIVNSLGDVVSMPSPNNVDMWVEIEAEIGQLNAAMNVGYAIYSESGHLLYWSYQTDESEKAWPRLSLGRVRLRSRIPSRLFNEGRFRIELICGWHAIEWLFEPGKNVPHVYLSIQGGLSDSPFWMMRRPGLLAPVIGWERVVLDRDLDSGPAKQEVPDVSQSSSGQVETNTTA